MSAEEYMLLVHAYKSTKGHATYWQIHSVTVSHGLFLGNHNELVRKLASHAALSSVAHLYQQGHHDEMQVEFREIMRLIHNYVAAVKSLVDHTRRIANKLLDKANFDAYQQRVDAEFKDDAPTRFLHDLRNYLLHVSHPPVKSTVRFSKNAIGSVGIELSPQGLLKWDGWTQQSLEFIKGYNDGIPIAILVDNYNLKVSNFYKWLIDHMNAACKPELDGFWARHHEWVDFCNRNGIPTTDEEWRKYIETDKGG